MSKSSRRLSLSVAALATGCAAIALTAAPANAASAPAPATTATPAHVSDDDNGSEAVFIQTDNTAGNQVVAYHRAADGTLALAHTYNTGGLGGILAGSAVDHTASQGALTYDAAHHLLYAVNAGSNTVSVFAVHGAALTLIQVVSSGGTFPVSVAVHGDVVYVLNAENGANIQGYRVAAGRLRIEKDWNRALGLDATGTPQFTHTPGQVGFTGDGRQLVVTTKAASNAVLVYSLGFDGSPAHTPTVNAFPGTVPFAFVATGRHQIALVQAGTNAVVTYAGPRRRHAGPAVLLRHRPGRDLLDRPRRRPAVRLQRRQRHRDQPAPHPPRHPDRPRQHRHRPGHRRRGGDRPQPVRADRRQRHRGRVLDRPQRRADPDRLGHRRRRGRRRGHRSGLTFARSSRGRGRGATPLRPGSCSLAGGEVLEPFCFNLEGGTTRSGCGRGASQSPSAATVKYGAGRCSGSMPAESML